MRRSFSPTFDPQRRASPRWLTVTFIAGPLMWVVFLIALAFVIREQRAVEIALVFVSAAFLVSLAVLIPMRARRVREERR